MRGRGAGCGRAAGFGRSGGAGMRGKGAGPATEAVCPKCGTKVPHERGVPCFQQKCPNCGSAMTRA